MQFHIQSIQRTELDLNERKLRKKYLNKSLGDYVYIKTTGTVHSI